MSWLPSETPHIKRKKNDSVGSHIKFESDDEDGSSQKKKRKVDAKGKNNVSAPPAKKKLSTPSDSEDGGDSEGESSVKAKEPKLPGNVVLSHVDGLLRFTQAHAPEIKGGLTLGSLKAVIPQYLDSVNSDMEPNELLKELKRYIVLAARANTTPFAAAAAMLHDHLSHPNALVNFAGFPAKPHRLFFIYCHQNGHKAFPIEKAVQERMQTDEKGRRKAEAEELKQKEQYLKGLKEYQAEHGGELSKEQLRWLATAIKRIDNALHPSEKVVRVKGAGTGPKKTKKAKKEPQTLFQIYCSLNGDKYPDLPPEKRMRKMQKKFDKLDETARDIFEKLAMRDQ